MKKMPRLSFWQIWNLSFGFLGVQFGFALQNANASRILTSLGADPHNLSFFWLVAPIMGLLVQPIVGAASDKTWTRIGRRSPYILGGAIVSMIAMFFMPNAPLVFKAGGVAALAFGVVMLALMDGSFNVTFQPFRALVADMTPDEQRNVGYSVQSFLINFGAVIGSALPFVLTAGGISNVADAGKVAPSVIWSFYIGGALLLLSVLVTVFKTKEYPPAEYEAYKNITTEDKEKKENFWQLLKTTPKVMRQLSLVQLFSWFPLFLLWVYSTTAISQHYFGVPIDYNASQNTDQALREAFDEAGNWVGICFAAYSLVAALYSIVLPKLISWTSRKLVYGGSLLLGGLSFISIFFFSNQYYLLIPMIGIGMAWAAILSMPYAILSGVLPPKRMGIYMGLFNLTVVVPQILSGVIGGPILRTFFGNQGVYILVLAGVIMVLGALSVSFVKSAEE
ncbi:maltose/moltooligosaccharide transporter [Saccharicrinis carchari]|uniref:Maltose/moltooligosaccharide transporter n=1 Tax=Saccharicrinis carchari TaxID=1168039 RepID=A0A521D681_SACCC|nr:MFS transporter [Saccharicrinis carchari]SMO67226.1 maltose/moltooligosaccharide transporter [Saccharicrinis carchari]